MRAVWMVPVLLAGIAVAFTAAAETKKVVPDKELYGCYEDIHADKDSVYEGEIRAGEYIYLRTRIALLLRDYNTFEVDYQLVQPMFHFFLYDAHGTKLPPDTLTEMHVDLPTAIDPKKFFLDKNSNPQNGWWHLFKANKDLAYRLTIEPDDWVDEAVHGIVEICPRKEPKVY